MQFNKKRALKIGTAVVALVAITLVAWPKAAQAASQVVSSMIKDQTIQSRDIAANGVGTSELRDGNTYFKDLSKGTQDLINGKSSKSQAQSYANKAEADAKGHANSVADSAQNAAQGYADANDDKGFNTARAGANYTQSIPANSVGVAYGKCPADRPLAISGGFRLNGHAAESFSGSDQPRVEGITVIASEPAAFKDGALVNSYQDPAFPQTEGGSFQANAWAVTVQNDTDAPAPVRAFATCVALN